MSVHLTLFKPYNRFWFSDCFYHSLAQIAGNLGVIDSLLTDEKIFFRFTEQEPYCQLELVREHFQGWVECFKRKGIEVDYIESDADTVSSRLKRSIDKKRPAILPIDCYYEPLRKDCYQKTHVAHNIVVNGYDDNNGCFLILEHTYENDLFYREATITYENAEQAYRSYFEVISRGKQKQAYIEVNTEHVKCFDDLIETKRTTIQALTVFENSLSELKAFNDLFAKNLIENIYNEDFISQTFVMIQNIFKVKKVQFSQIEAVCNILNLPESRTHLNTVNHWNLLMSLFLKFKYTKLIPNNRIESISTFMQNIYLEEKIWLRDIISVLRSDKNELSAY